MKLVFIYGPPASGKLTVARELAALTGYKLFHNHLVVDTLGAVFEFGSAPFVELRERIWIDVMTAASAAGIDGLIFTFAPERTVRDGFVDALRCAVAEAGGELVFVRLECGDTEIERRLDDPSRRGGAKLRSIDVYRELKAAGAFDAPQMPDPAIAIDTEDAPAAAAAARIAAFLEPR